MSINIIVVLLGSSFICGLIASRFGLPPLIGYMISGMALGWRFADADMHIQEIGEIPLIVLLFIAGLHLDLGTFVKDAKSSIKFTFVQMAFVALAGVFALLLPTTLWQVLIEYGHLVSALILPFFYLVTQGRQIQTFFQADDYRGSISIIFAVSTIFMIATTLIKIYWSCPFVNSVSLIRSFIFISVAIFPVCLQIPNKLIKVFVVTLISILGVSDFLLSPTHEIITLQVKFLLSAALGVALCLIPSYLIRASKMSKYLTPGIFAVQASLAAGSFFLPGLKHFTPLVTLMEFSHCQILVMMIGLFSIHSTAIAFKLMETKPIGHPNDTEESVTLIKPAVKGVLIAQDLLTVFLLIILRSFSDTASLTSIPRKLVVAILILYMAKKISKAQPSFISRFLDRMLVSIELITLFVFSFCFACAFLGNLLGLSDLYGGFVGGFLLGNVYHQRRKAVLMSCEPIGDMLMVFFFIHIGFLFKTDKVIHNLPVILFTNVMIIGIKYFANYQGGVVAYNSSETPKFDKNSLMLMSILMTQVTEFWFLFLEIVEPAFIGTAFEHFFEVVRSSCIVSLTFGCLLTVLIRQYLFRKKIL